MNEFYTIADLQFETKRTHRGITLIIRRLKIKPTSIRRGETKHQSVISMLDAKKVMEYCQEKNILSNPTL